MITLYEQGMSHKNLSSSKIVYFTEECIKFVDYGFDMKYNNK